MKDEILQENIELWTRSNPKAAVFLPYHDVKHVALCKTEWNEDNLKIVDNQFLHANSGALKEAELWFSSLNLSDTEVLYVYGIGLGYGYEAAKKWLHENPKRHLVFLEDNLSVIRIFFEMERSQEMMRDPQVQLIYFEHVEEANSPLSEVYWIGTTLKMQVSALPSYEREKGDIYRELTQKLIYESTLHETMLQEYLDYGLPFFQNFYPNMLCMEGTYLGNKLTGKFKNVPAIICGAGPSLNKQIPLLSELKDKAVIFAGGSAMNALNVCNFQPHFGAGIDPNPMQLERLENNSAFEVPYFFRNRMNHKAFKMIHGPKLYIAGSGGYDISEWLEDKFDISSQFIDEGFNVVNFSLEIARVLGCNPIILVGLDLAFTGMETYASGIEEDISVTEEKLLVGKDLDEVAILRKDVFGKPIYTLWKWVAEANWISSFAKAVSEGTQIVNATEGGIEIPDVPNVTFKEAVTKHLKHQYDLSTRLHGEIQNSTLEQITKAKLIAALRDLHDSLVRCRDHLDVLIADAKQVIEEIKQKQDKPEVLQGGLAVLSEIELAEEPAYLHILAVFNQVFTKVLVHEMQQMHNAKEPEWLKAMHRLEINNKKLEFLRNVAHVHVFGIEQTLGEHDEK